MEIAILPRERVVPSDDADIAAMIYVVVAFEAVPSVLSKYGVLGVARPNYMSMIILEANGCGFVMVDIQNYAVDGIKSIIWDR